MNSLIDRYKDAESLVGKIPEDGNIPPEMERRMYDHKKAWLVAKGAWLVAMASVPVQSYIVSQNQITISEPSDYIGVTVGALGFSLWALSMKRLLLNNLSQNAPKTDGVIYGNIRHPAYAGFRLGSLGILCVEPSLESLIATAGVFVATELCARAEEIELTVRYGKEYFDYMQRTGRFLP